MVFHQLTVTAVQPLTPDAVALSFAVPEPLATDFAFEAGQHLTLRRPGHDERRSYSICAAPGQPLRIGVRRVDGGEVSPWLTEAVEVGDVIEAEVPTGRFHAGGVAGGRHLLLAAGSGITPMLGIARSLLGSGARVSLVFANRRTSSVMFVDEIADLKDEYLESFEVLHVLSREPREVDLFSGRLDRQRVTAIVDSLVGEVDHAWLCGPFNLVTLAHELLRERGVEVHLELFYVEQMPPEQARHIDRAPSGATSSVMIVLDGKRTTADLPTSQSLLDSAQTMRADLPFACKGGVCGTCRARVTVGEVDLRRNFALDEAELAQGFVLTCQSFPVSERVRIDFDA